MSTEKAEGLGRDTGGFQEMGFTIEKTGIVTAKSRALKV